MCIHVYYIYNIFCYILAIIYLKYLINFSQPYYWFHSPWIFGTSRLNSSGRAIQFKYATFALFPRGLLIICIFFTHTFHCEAILKYLQDKFYISIFLKKMKQYYRMTWTNFIYSKHFLKAHVLPLYIHI